MKTAIATVSIAGELPEKLEAIAAAGFDGIEIFETDFLAFDGGPKEVAKMVRDKGLEISLFQPFRDFEGMPGAQRQRAFDRAERKFDLMDALGADLVLICSNASIHSLGGIDRAADDLAELGQLAAQRGIRIGYEALAWGRHVSDHRDAWEIVRRADHDNVGIILDSFHTLSRKIDPESIRSIPGDKIFFVQLADAPQIEMDLLYWSRHFRNMPGEGDLNVTGFMRAIAATGYDGILSLEIFNDQFRGGSPRSIAADGHRSLIYLMDNVRRVEPDIKLDVPVMPSRVAVEGIEFVEFAADELEAQQLGDILKTLGFHAKRQHISKDVTVWSQGDINIVVNSEREGFAHSAYIAHGTSICDIGLKVSNVDELMVRAKALGATAFSQPLGPGEIDIPAIRGVGGGLMHFLDSSPLLSKVWQREFSLLPDQGHQHDCGLARVDHVAQTMNYEEMLTWVLFYISIFETEKSPMVDVVDPSGLVRSQVIENSSGSLRITLNGAENQRTLAGRFVAETFGSSVQHIALASDDIFATAQKLKASGFQPLEISPNYYDDLGARLGLDAEFVAQLSAAKILYDQDEDGGAFFQLYSQSYGDGFFFEIVERRGGYKGYGAVNAPFRIAAQKRAARPASIPAK